MKLKHLRDMTAIAAHGSIRNAARHLLIAQSAITRSVRELEYELGITLFERQATGMVPTLAGEAFLRKAVAIENDLRRARDEVEQMNGKLGGRVSLGLAQSSHSALLPSVIEPFRRRFPDAEITISEGSFAALERQLLDASIDVYVGPAVGVTSSARLSVEALSIGEFSIVARHDHPLIEVDSLLALAGCRWVTTSPRTTLRDDIAALFATHGMPMPNVAVYAETTLSVVSVVGGSDMLALLPEPSLSLLAMLARLRPIRVREHLPRISSHLIRRAYPPLTPAAQHFCDMVRADAEASGARRD